MGPGAAAALLGLMPALAGAASLNGPEGAVEGLATAAVEAPASTGREASATAVPESRARAMRDARASTGQEASATAVPEGPASAAQGVAGTPARETGLVLTLSEAIARALRNDEIVLVRREALEAARSAETGAQGAYDPVLAAEIGWHRVSEPVSSAFAAATRETTDTGVEVRRLLPTGGQVSISSTASRGSSDSAFDLLSPSYGSRVGVELRQPLLRDRKVDAARLGIRVSAADSARAGAALRREVIDTVAAVERAYWALVAARLAIDVREQAVELAAEQLEQTRLRIDGGVEPETRVAEPQAELARRRGELLEARETVARSENALRLLVLGEADDGLWTREIVPADGAEVEVVPVDVAAAMESALATRAELDAAEAVVDRRRAETAFARDGVRPALDLVLSYDRLGLAGSPVGEAVPGLPVTPNPGLEGGWWDSYETLFGGGFDDARIGLVLELPLGNRSARAAAAIAGSGERQARADLTRARKVVRAEVLDAAAALQTARSRIEAARAAREAAEVQLFAERERFAEGLSTNFLVLTRQNDLARARLDEIAALTDYRTARTELLRASGTLLEERAIEVQQR